jgi:hypothetical protein
MCSNADFVVCRSYYRQKGICQKTALFVLKSSASSSVHLTSDVQLCVLRTK